jgi:hypothetical protein
MTCLSRIVFLFFFVFGVSGIAAQQTGNSIDEVYGSDPLLYNGKYYTFYPPSNTGSHQYFADRQFETGSVIIRGVTYSDLLLNYDIYNQQLILKYKFITGATNLIIISDAWLEMFSYRDANFVILSTPDTLKRIFQTLGTGPKRILYYWRKTLNLDNFYGAKNYVFSAAAREMNVFADNQILEYSNNKGFYSLFDPDKRFAVREYLNKNNIRVKKANDKTMTDLINFCNTLYAK